MFRTFTLVLSEESVQCPVWLFSLLIYYYYYYYYYYILLLFLNTFMHGIYKYIPETNRVSQVHIVVAVLYL
jgi:hypothetical protein